MLKPDSHYQRADVYMLWQAPEPHIAPRSRTRARRKRVA
jgi:hypothetical protein